LPVSSTSAITSDQQHSIFQLPFGAAFRYNVAPESQFQPYAGVQLGASYSEMSTYMNVMKVYDRNWGFYVSPEIGMTMYFTPQKQGHEKPSTEALLPTVWRGKQDPRRF
jgi:outer membrane protein W